jgi:hypothetical protein
VCVCARAHACVPYVRASSPALTSSAPACVCLCVCVCVFFLLLLFLKSSCTRKRSTHGNICAVHTDAGNSGGPVVDVKAWKAAQKAAAAGAGNPDEEESKAERQKRFATTGAAAACEASAKQALSAVTKSDKKNEVVKGFVNTIAAQAKDKTAEEASGPLAAVPKGQYFEKTPRHRQLTHQSLLLMHVSAGSSELAHANIAQ